jgi:hypothetical protein
MARRRRGLFLTSSGCWLVVVVLWVVRLAGAHPVALDALMVALMVAGLGCTIAAGRLR